MKNNGVVHRNEFLLEKILIVMMSCVLIAILFMIHLNTHDQESSFHLFTISGIVIFVWIILTWHRFEKNFINLYSFFMAFSVLFYLGQPIALLLTNENTRLKVHSIEMYPYALLNKTLLYVLVAYLLIHIGAILFKKKIAISKKFFKENYDYTMAMNIVGFFLLIISTIPTLILISNSLKAVLEHGYIGLFIASNTIAVNGGLIGITAGFFIPSLFILLIANSHKKKKWYIYSGIFFIYIIIVFILGRRGENSIYLLGYILIWHNLISPITGKKLVKILIFGFIMIFILAIISQVRAYLNTGNIIEIISNLILNLDLLEFIRDMFGEFGITLLVPATIIDKVPSAIPFYNGKSILNFFLLMIPNVFWDINPGLIDGTLEGIVSPFIRQGTLGGVGGSFVAEIYYNFGYFGYVTFPLIGVFLHKLNNILSLKTKKINKLNFFFSIYLFTVVIWVIRSEMMTVGKEILYFAVFPIALIKLVNKLISKRNVMIHENKVGTDHENSVLNK
ncbi:O-antigen polysaccharide polymerase Wzy [Clostridium amylolyticum]|uniref:O-antigen polysaccharide polymerase Wzy n=1 Tax=Clostridium amylolyticum TaxID=1121298 RepID=A0A1M6M6Y0_9CLOT|nr:O-antigen polysaccharide polymerase Wzy [Clostridium amylolyticum]SHJ79160.1 O-antigen polysaccharide polymerase Wzy [Clostridium amylolyticum]